MVEVSDLVGDDREDPGLRADAARRTHGEVEKANNIGDLAKNCKEADPRVQEWLAVLARCFQLQEAVGVLALDRVLDTSPKELDQHRLALRPPVSTGLTTWHAALSGPAAYDHGG